MIERDEIDLDQLMREAETAAAEADAALERLSLLEGDDGTRAVRTLDERRQAVLEVVDAATPERKVRTPAERRAAVQQVLEERERQRQRKRAERAAAERQAAEEPPPASGTPVPLPLNLPEHPPHVEAVVEANLRERRPRTAAQRMEDARGSAMEELERRRQESAERARRLLEGREHSNGKGKTRPRS